MFTGLNFEEQLQTSYHTIVTDHPYMHEIGLSSFTTGELYDWMMKQNSSKDFTNLRLIDQVKWKAKDTRDLKPKDIENNIKLAAGLILGQQNSGGSEGNLTERYYFTAPRVTEDPKTPQLRPVEYVKFNNAAWQKWTYTNKNGTVSYTAKDLDFNYFAGKVFETTEYVPLPANPNIPLELISESPRIGYHLDDKICHVIEMNNYARLLNAILPESEWNKYAHLTSESAIAEFVRDIKASKEQCIQWEGYVPFVLNFDGINTASKCVKNVKVKYKLYLYDMATPKDASRKITFTNDFTIVGQHIDPLGRIGQKEDGEVITPSPQGNPNESIAANLRVYYNPSTRKYESGTAQMIARMLDDLAPAKATDLNKLLTLSVKDLQSPQNQHLVTVGEAVPIINQNANPLLWAPEYGEPKDCRSSDDKNKLIVYNVSHKRFKKGETVLLQNIGGAWVPSSLGEPDTGGSASFDGKWAFTYLMTNADAFFRNIKGDLLSYNAYEMGVHNCYYKGDQFNVTSTGNAAGTIDVFNGYYQITSFDFMGKRIGGTRDTNIDGGIFSDVGNSIACTQFSISPDGETLENDGKFLYGKTSAPFFGCIFPDGYSNEGDAGEKIKTYLNATPEIKGFQYDAMLDKYKNQALIFTDIPANTKMFENKNDNNKNTSAANKQGMFYAINSETPSYDLKHLPADIGTNASPTGIYGYPITNINSIWRSFIPYSIDAYKETSNSAGIALNSNEFQNQVESYLFHIADTNIYNLDYNNTTVNNDQIWIYSRLNWLYINKPNSVFDSAFDLKPVTVNKIQFRPLKTELFAAWECPIRPTWLMSPTNQNVVLDKSFSAPRGVFGAINWELLESDNPVLSYASFGRNNNQYWRNWLFWPQPEGYGVWRDILDNNKPYRIGPSLRYNNDIFYRYTAAVAPTNAFYKDAYSNPRHPAYNVGQFPCKGGNTGCAKCWIPDENANFPKPWWSRRWMLSGSSSEREITAGAGSRGAGGIGIIAAQAELSAYKGVTFTTQNYIGVRSWFLNKTWYPSWGWKNDYNSFNTIALHAKIMHKWPRQLTIYDPRFFAVFHFNPPGAYVDPSTTWYNGEEIIPTPDPIPTVEYYPTGIYSQQIANSSVDIKIPTLYNGAIVPDGTYIYSDAGILGQLEYPIRDPAFWQVNYSRRNKLLPYKYKTTTITIPNDAETLLGSKVASACNSIIILSGGQGYKATDTFTTIGGPPSVTHAVLLPILNNGTITGFTYASKKITSLGGNGIQTVDDPQHGAGFYPSHFADKDDIIDGNYTFKIKIVPLIASGSGFSGGVIRGKVNFSPLMEDAKPGYATASEVLELSAKPPSTGATSSNKYDSGGSIESTVIKEVDAVVTTSHGITNPSPDNKYDLFLFFHNDISANMMEAWDTGGAGVAPVPQENHITLTVNPT